ncbi:exosortase C-terminal domain/associated protein EpsI [Amphiplicatus metriothermophilus]|uniref:EpsI family protein n=1 Tax=Amphiplicatus metriothermophilus TaxID=1519374 RepID=A0A239PPW7_9PROT|nr:exosortase C-terminal domain/associated protein EpsI [Amphiplicatus metriothermophilus]MBB5518891.1 EpsI family protein [Amphiplicatus metriothermophilus]SNT71956.1 EpsI family protein [Amphiplicatus metriothermophilus]
MTEQASIGLGRPVVAATPGAPWRQALIAYGVFALAVCALLWPSLADMAQQWTTSSTWRHGALAAPLALGLILLSRREAACPRFWPPALIPAGAAAFMWLAGYAGNAAIVEQLAFVSLLIAGAIFAFGPTNAKAWAIPFALLFFMVPFGEIVLPVLQTIAAQGALALANMLGAEARLDGRLIDTPKGTLLIAPSCAGLNFLLAATMLALAYSHFARLSAGRAVAFVGVAAAVAILANIARVALIITITARSGGAVEIAADHFGLSLAFYGIILLALAALARRFAGAQTAPPATPAPTPASRRAGAALLFAALVSLPTAAGAYARFVVDRAPGVIAPASLPPLNAPGWRILPSTNEWDVPPADSTTRIAYAQGGAGVEVVAAYLTYERRGTETTALAVPPAGWRKIENDSTLHPPLSGYRPLSADLVESAAGRRFALTRFYWLGDTPFTDARALKLAQVGRRLRGRQDPAGAFILLAPADDDASPGESLAAFLADAEPFARWRARLRDRLRG